MSPTAAGSIKSSAGPLIVLLVTLIAEPSAPVWNAVAVAIPETFRVSVSVCPVTSIPLDLVASFREP